MLRAHDTGGQSDSKIFNIKKIALREGECRVRALLCRFSSDPFSLQGSWQSTYMVNGVDLSFIFKNKNLIFHIPRHVNIFNLFRGPTLLGDIESLASRRNPVVLVVPEVWEFRTEANPLPGCSNLPPKRIKHVEMTKWYLVSWY